MKSRFKAPYHEQDLKKDELVSFSNRYVFYSDEK